MMSDMNTTQATPKTKAEREAAHVAAYLARRGYEELPESYYGPGSFRVIIPVPLESRNGRKVTKRLVRHIEVAS
jgi:hypothetical protein